jgi:hypothetical protein
VQANHTKRDTPPSKPETKPASARASSSSVSETQSQADEIVDHQPILVPAMEASPMKFQSTENMKEVRAGTTEVEVSRA